MIVTARVDLGLSERAAWRLTPRLYAALAARVGERRQAEQQRADLRAGWIAATLVNLRRDPRKRPEPITPADFFPSLRPLFAAASGRREQSADELLAVAHLWAGVTGTALEQLEREAG